MLSSQYIAAMHKTPPCIPTVKYFLIDYRRQKCKNAGSGLLYPTEARIRAKYDWDFNAEFKGESFILSYLTVVFN